MRSTTSAASRTCGRATPPSDAEATTRPPGLSVCFTDGPGSRNDMEREMSQRSLVGNGDEDDRDVRVGTSGWGVSRLAGPRVPSGGWRSDRGCTT